MGRWRTGLLAGVFSMAMATGLVCGCGGGDRVPRGGIEGSVSFDGTPVEQGTISFVPAEGTKGPATYATITNGRYAIAAEDRGPVVGKHRVKIEAFRDMGKKHPVKGVPLLEQVVPARFNTTTTLVVEINQGRNVRDFELRSK